ncbi:uncharacterized protein LOC134223316 [Armigeres subalbatus]|uniref:uncharacterized protein LOC134223316 n=1 Tax=Armigeres subalbatus TaxID=124917 RepID=UPI002ED4F0EF
MEECYPLHRLLLREKKTFDEILHTFPHFASYNGIMINEAFYRMKPHVSRQLEFSPVLGRALLLVSGMFSSIEDSYVRGTLRIFTRLQKKGMKSNQAGPSNMILAEQILVSPLLQWSQDIEAHVENTRGEPHIVCESSVFGAGKYSIIFNGVILASSVSFIEVLDIFWKSFVVFGVVVPTKLQMCHDVFSILVYGTLQQSKRKSVNELCTNLREAIKAESAQ